MDFAVVHEIRLINILRTTQRIVERLFQVHKSGKMNDESYVVKLEKLKDVVVSNINKAEEIKSKILSRKEDGVNFLNVFVMEHFEHIGCFKTAKIMAEKFSISNYSDINFYYWIYAVKAEICRGMFDNGLEFCREYRFELKRLGDAYFSDLEECLKIEKFMIMCFNGESCKAVEFVSKEFRKIPDKIRPHLLALVSNRILRKWPGNRHVDAANRFFKCALTLFKRGEKSRLVKRVEYAMMAYKTYKCALSENKCCPTCCKAFELRNDVPQNKHEISILLCRGNSEEMDDANRPYVLEDGSVYGEKYINSAKHACIEKKIPDNILGDLKPCFFI